MIHPQDLMLEPFYQIHDARYIMYWMAFTDSQYHTFLDSLAAAEKEKLALQKRTIDFVAPGEQQPEADRLMKKSNSNSGVHLDAFWRDARDGGYFSYQMTTNQKTDLSLMVRYWGYEWGGRKFNICIDDTLLISEDNTGRWYQADFQDAVYEIPDTLVAGKDYIRVKFQAAPGSTAGSVYFIRLIRQED